LRRELNDAARLEQRGGRLEEQQRLDGNLVAKFRRVFAIVAPDADDLRRSHRRQQVSGAERHRLEVQARGIQHEF